MASLTRKQLAAIKAKKSNTELQLLDTVAQMKQQLLAQALRQRPEQP